jgi:hypothetical protein
MFVMKKTSRGQAMFLLVTTVILVMVYLISTRSLYKAGDGIGYNLGLAGGLMMLSLLLYPLRKRVGCLRNFGILPRWFKWHMVLGILGPAAILFHSTFQICSVNAGVAMLCMVLVAGSGFFGRFCHSRIYRGFYVRQAALAELRLKIERSADIQAMLSLAPTAAKKLDDFRRLAESGLNKLEFGKFVAFEVKAKSLLSSLSTELHLVARQEQSAADAGLVCEALASYIKAIRDVAQFHSCERLFSWWHVFHVPLVYMMVLSAIYHIYAVHYY